MQSENFKGQNVEILTTRKANIVQNLQYITSNIARLKSAFTQSRGLYNTLGRINDQTENIQGKKEAIN